jgi:diguanylate cyclase (GGDEF)-like protein
VNRSEAEEFARRHLRFAPNAVVMIFEADLRLSFVDGAAVGPSGHNPDEIMGRELSEVVPAGDWERLKPYYARILHGETQEFEFDSFFLGRTYRVRGEPIVAVDGGVQGGLLIAQEQMAHPEDPLRARLQQQSAVAELGRLAISEDSGLAGLIDTAVRMVVNNLDAVMTSSVVQLLPGEDHFLVRTEATGSLTGRRLPLAGSLVQRVLDARNAVVFPDAAVDPFPPALVAMGVRSAACVVIGRPEAPFGVLSAFGAKPNLVGEHDVHFLQAIGNVLAEASRREQADGELRRQALHDAVTGLPNRTLLGDRLRHSLAFAERAGLRVAVLFVDLDRFKVINDSLGHQAGDQVLQAVADRLRSAVRRSDTVARFGGDEFVIVAPTVEDEQDAIRIAETIQALLEAPIPVGGQQLYVRASVGICVASPTDEADPQALIRDADAALYRAKAQGRGRYAVARADAGRPSANQLVVEQDLRHALASDQLRMVFQPIVRLSDGATVGAEVLLRWQHPSAKYLKPGDFLNVAEQSGLIVPIGEWMLRHACRHAVRWSADRDFLLTVNVSAGQLADPGIVAAVRAALGDSGLAPAKLGLELTEHVLVGDEVGVYRTLADLKALGVKLLLDDFGTGYSSLSHLKRFPIDVVKIDRSFTEGLGAGPSDDAAIVAAIVGMSDATGKQVIPEGVETDTQARELQRMGCDLGQGYFFSCPMKTKDFNRWMARAA